jgi:diacylglycerol kinase family enzyme
MRRRAAAVTALVASAALAVVVVLFLVRNAGGLALGLVGLAVAVGGAWWVLVETMPRRGIGGVAILVGLALLVVGFVEGVDGVDRIVLRTLLSIVLLALAMISAQAAMLDDVAHDDDAASVAPPRHAVLICNPKSGGGKVERFGLIERARELGVETVILEPGLDLAQLARDAVARGADCLGMAGGDGSQALVASIAIEHDVPFVCVSAGTRNHFALDLGLDREDPRRSMDAFRDAIERRVDYAMVGDRLFVNNVSLGVYASIVEEEGYRDAKVETARGRLPEILGAQAEPFDLQFTTPDGTNIDGAILVMVSNDPYTLGLGPDSAQRRRLDTGELGVFAVTTSTGAEAARLVANAALGRRKQSPFWHEFTTREFEVRSRSGSARAGVDGEALELPTPLQFRSHPGGLRLLVPRGNLHTARRRRARDVHLRGLIAIAAGRDPAT